MSDYYTEGVAKIKRFRDAGLDDVADNAAALLQRDALEQLASEGNPLARLVVAA